MRTEFNMANLLTPRCLGCEPPGFETSIFTPARRRFWQR